MPDKILFIPSLPEAMPELKQEILSICQNIGGKRFDLYYLCVKPGPGFSVYHATRHEFAEPIKEIKPCILEQWRSTAFQRLLRKEDFTHCIFFEPEIAVQKLIPIARCNNVKAIVYERRNFFQACPITDKYVALFRGSSYALANKLVARDSASAASWLCAGFPGSIKEPGSSSGWEEVLLEPQALPQAVSAFQGFQVFEEAFNALEKQLPYLCPIPQLPPPLPEPEIRNIEVIKEVIREVEVIREIDITKPWQKKLEKIVDKSFPHGSFRRKIARLGGKIVWKTLKFIKGSPH